jgi:hypothetical protein
MIDRVFRDIKQGENIDLYVAVVAAIGLAFMSVLGLVPTTSLTPLNLTILALMTFALLGNRHRLDAISERTSLLSSQLQFVEEFPPAFSEHLDEAKEIWLIGTHHSSTLTAHYDLFERKVKGGGSLRALLIEPNGAACNMTAMRFPERVSPDHERVRILSSLDRLCDLRTVAPSNVDIRVIDFLLDYSAVLLDPGSSSAVVYLERNTFRTSGGSRKPKFIYHRKDGRWFEHICTEIQELWKSGSPGHVARVTSAQGRIKTHQDKKVPYEGRTV